MVLLTPVERISCVRVRVLLRDRLVSLTRILRLRSRVPFPQQDEGDGPAAHGAHVAGGHDIVLERLITPQNHGARTGASRAERVAAGGHAVLDGA